MTISYLQELNEAQRAAVECTEGPIMVIAGAGSGKTRVLTYKVAHLLHLGVDPFNILCLTFTNKAAREMKDRILKIIGQSDARNVWMGTFHSIFARILRVEGGRLGYPSNFTIYDTSDSKNLIKSICKDLQLDDKTYKPNVVLSRLSAAKSSLISWEDYIQNASFRDDDHANRRPFIGQIYEIYQKRCFKSGVMDFDDILFNMYILLNEHPQVLLKYQNIFKYILVDEYQDTNFAQYQIIKRLAARLENICVVGDDAQSIYAFRGANIENILGFNKDYSDCRTFKLEQNYRSTGNIVNAANTLILHNKNQLKKTVWTENEIGEKIKVVRHFSDQEEGLFVAHNIFETKQNNQLSYSDFAILYRTNAQSRVFEESLRRNNIPYKIYGGISFYQRKEIKDMLAYFRLVINNNDEEALLRIINVPIRGIGKTTIEKLLILSNDNAISVWRLLTEIENTGNAFNQGTVDKIKTFVQTIQSYSALLERRNAYDLAFHIANSSGLLTSLLQDQTPEGVSRKENLDELLNGIKEFVENDEINELPTGAHIPDDRNLRTLDVFMQDIALLTDADDTSDADTEYVSLMTIHASKGLEFPYVYIVGMEEGLFPSNMAVFSREEIEEERRLFYVALTRGMKRSVLSYAQSRYRYGKLEYFEPSRFIEEIDEKFLEMPDIGKTAKPESNRMQQRNFMIPSYKQEEKPKPAFSKGKLMNLSTAGKLNPMPDDNTADLKPGDTVEHPRFGIGKVIAIEGPANSSKATVLFEDAGTKQLLLKFAKLKIIK